MRGWNGEYRGDRLAPSCERTPSVREGSGQSGGSQKGEPACWEPSVVARRRPSLKIGKQIFERREINLLPTRNVLDFGQPLPVRARHPPYADQERDVVQLRRHGLSPLQKV